MVEPLPYRAAVGILLLNQTKHIFVGQRLDSTLEAWQMPQGGIDPGELPEHAARRELAEETGISAVTELGRSSRQHDYDLPADLQGKLWGGRYRGQRQTWFAFAFDGVDADVNIATSHPEFRAWMWASADEVLDRVVPFKRDLYRGVLAEFGSLLGW